MKKSLIGLNAFNSKSKVNNANWENATKEATYIENGDSISLKASFIDSRNRVTGNINLDQDTTIELSYMFYYINRGGTPNKSLVNDPKFPNRQQLPLEYFNNGTENPNTYNPTTGISPSNPNGTSGIANLPITDPTEKTPENLAPLVESIVHPYSTNAITSWFDPTGLMPSVNFSQMIVGQFYQITSLGDISVQLWNEVGATSAPYVGQIFKCVASPSSGTDDVALLLYDLEKISHIRANNPVGFTNTIDANNPDGLPYLLSYCSPKNIDGTTTFDAEILDAGEIKPFIKKWKMVLKRGSYTADYLAEIITRGMSIQKQKVQTTISGGSRFLGTPNASINSQLYNSDDFSYIRNKYTIPDDGTGFAYKQASSPYYGFIPPNCEQGGFPSQNQLPSNINQFGDQKMLNPASQFEPLNIGKAYQPNLMFNPKNKNILPGYDGNETTLPDTLPVNPKYTELDFNNPDSNIQDDTPFIYRPNAFTMRDSQNPSQAKVRLTYNDYNLSNFNGIKPFGDVADQNIKNIEMMYRPLVSDMDSSYFTTIQKQNGLPVNKDYSIKPIISVPVAQLPAINVNQEKEGINQAACYSAPTSISTPLVGAPLMNLTYNQENNGLFEFAYMHTPIYAKLTAQSEDVQECVGMYPNSISVVTYPANNDVIFSIESPVEGNNIDPTSWFTTGQIFIPDRLSELTATSVYGIPINNFSVIMNTFTLNYDNTKPTQYASSTAILNFTFFDKTDPNIQYTLNVGEHLVIKGSLLKGVDKINDLVITILTIEEDVTDYTYTLSGTPSTLFYQSIQQLSSVVQLAQQSGIIFYDMKATKADGTTTPFWENLGFNPSNMTYKADEPLTYEKFLSLTTKGFLGSSNIFDSETLSSGTTEQSYITYTDSLNMLGWYDQSQVGASYCNNSCTYNSIDVAMETYFNSIYNQLIAEVTDKETVQLVSGEAYGVFTLQKKILYSLVETTVPLSATNTFTDNTDAGHYLICIEGYGGSYLLTDNDKLNVKSLVSTYYTGPNAFVSNNLADSALYEHIGSPMKIQNFKVRILNAFTGDEVGNLGPNSSIYLEITKNLNKNNILNLTSSN